MATGILAIASSQRGWVIPSLILLVLAGVAYAVLVVLTLWRLAAHRDAVATDLRDPRTAFQAFTFVAGTGEIGRASCRQSGRTPCWPERDKKIATTPRQ